MDIMVLSFHHFKKKIVCSPPKGNIHSRPLMLFEVLVDEGYYLTVSNKRHA